MKRFNRNYNKKKASSSSSSNPVVGGPSSVAWNPQAQMMARQLQLQQHHQQMLMLQQMQQQQVNNNPMAYNMGYGQFNSMLAPMSMGMPAHGGGAASSNQGLSTVSHKLQIKDIDVNDKFADPKVKKAFAEMYKHKKMTMFGLMAGANGKHTVDAMKTVQNRMLKDKLPEHDLFSNDSERDDVFCPVSASMIAIEIAIKATNPFSVGGTFVRALKKEMMPLVTKHSRFLKIEDNSIMDIVLEKDLDDSDLDEDDESEPDHNDRLSGKRKRGKGKGKGKGKDHMSAKKKKKAKKGISKGTPAKSKSIPKPIAGRTRSASKK